MNKAQWKIKDVKPAKPEFDSWQDVCRYARRCSYRLTWSAEAGRIAVTPRETALRDLPFKAAFVAHRSALESYFVSRQDHESRLVQARQQGLLADLSARGTHAHIPFLRVKSVFPQALVYGEHCLSCGERLRDDPNWEPPWVVTFGRSPIRCTRWLAARKLVLGEPDVGSGALIESFCPCGERATTHHDGEPLCPGHALMTSADWRDSAAYVVREANVGEMTYVTESHQLEPLLRAAMAARGIAFDTETYGGSPVGVDVHGLDGQGGSKPRLCQIGVETSEGRRTWVVDFFGVNPEALRPIFERTDCTFVGHNLSFDFQMLQKVLPGLDFPDGERLYDTQIVHQALKAGLIEAFPNKSGLDDLAWRYLSVKLDKSYQKSNWGAAVLSEGQIGYAATDAGVLLDLVKVLHPQIVRAGLKPTLAREMGALPMLWSMEQHGIPIDPDYWRELADLAYDEMIEHANTLGRLYGHLDAYGGRTLFDDSSIKWSSKPSIQKAFLALDVVLEKTEAEDFVALKGHANPTIVQMAETLLKFKDAFKRQSTYGRKFLGFLAPGDRIHPSLYPLGASRTGRVSSSRPNLQNIKRDALYRRAFRPRRGRVWIKGDLSQIELRIIAEITRDPRMLAAYAANDLIYGDLHRLTAAAVLGISPEAVTRDQRTLAKAVNFGFCYGMGAEKFVRYAAKDYEVFFSKAEAEAARNAYFDLYRGVRKWHYSINGREPITTRTLGGRHRLMVERFTEKANSPVQGTGADMMKAALGLLWARRHEVSSSVLPILTVHDEIDVECDEAEAWHVADWLERALIDGSQGLLQHVPTGCEVDVQTDWSGETKLKAASQAAGKERAQSA